MYRFDHDLIVSDAVTKTWLTRNGDSVRIQEISTLYSLSPVVVCLFDFCHVFMGLCQIYSFIFSSFLCEICTPQPFFALEYPQ